MKFEYTNAKGTKIEFVATAKKKVYRPSGINSGDLAVRTEDVNQHISASYKITVLADGKEVAKSEHSTTKEWKPVKLGKMSAEAYKLPVGTELVRVNSAKFVMPDDVRAAYIAWLDEVEASGETEETMAFRAEVEAQNSKGKAARLEKKIAEAEAQTNLPATKAEAEKIEKRQKEFLAEEHDAEWAEDFTRHIYSVEELEEMRARLAELRVG